MRKQRKNKVIGVLLGIFVVITIVAYLIFSKGAYNNIQTSQAAGRNLIKVFTNTMNNGGIMELSDSDINSLVISYFNKDKDQNNINLDYKSINIPVNKNIFIKGFAVKINESDITAYIPVKYKSMSFLLSSKGSIVSNGEYIGYKPRNFKIGRITLPMNLILNNIDKYLNEQIS